MKDQTHKIFLNRLIHNFVMFVLFCLMAPFTYADYVEKDSEKIGNFTVQYTVFNSQFILADIANLHGLVRAKDQALVNISVLDNATGKTVAATIKGRAKNLLQQTKTIDFKAIQEQDAVYYIGALRHTNEEVFHFTIDINIDGQDHTIKFIRKLYVEA